MSIARKYFLMLIGALFLLQPLLSNAAFALHFSHAKGEVATAFCDTVSVKTADQCADMAQGEKQKECCDNQDFACKSMTGCNPSFGSAMLPHGLETHQGSMPASSFGLTDDSLSDRSLPPAFTPPKQII